MQKINFRPLAGHKVFLDTAFLSVTVDKDYLVSTLRQHLLASGCILTTSRTEATYVVEARAGSIGTNRSELLFGVPSLNLPLPIPGVPTSIPEIPVVKKTNHRGVAKLGVFAYHRETGTPVWQSGLVRDESSGKDMWVFGAGPFQQGTIHEGTAFAGSRIPNPLKGERNYGDEDPPVVAIGEERVFEQRSPDIYRLPEVEDPPPERTASEETAQAAQ